MTETLVQNPATEATLPCVLSISGGMDSTSLLLQLLSEGRPVRAYSFYYGQRHSVELKKLEYNIGFLQDKGFDLEWQVIDVEDIFSGNTSALHVHNVLGDTIPHGHYADDNMKRTVVPLRNVIFSTIVAAKAINYAVENNTHVNIALGLHAGDHAIYPDCRPESQQAAAELYRISDWNGDKIEYIAPFIHDTKGQVLVKGITAAKTLGLTDDEIKDILAHTHTCYDPDEDGTACGLCGACTERLEAFAYASVQLRSDIMDPVQYTDHTQALAAYEAAKEQFKGQQS